MASDPHDVPRRKLGAQGLEVSALGLGCMGLSPWFGKGACYGDGLKEEEAIAVVHHAYNKAVTFFDTSNAYGPYENEKMLGKALKNFPREKVQLATKFSIVIIDGEVHNKGTPKFVRKSCEESLERLGLEYIDLYYQHRVDTKTPIEVTVGELKKLVEEGKVKYIGLSEANADTIRRAHAVHPITAVQFEWSLWTRDIEAEIVPLCRELGIGIVPYSPLGRGFFSGKAVVEELVDGDSRTERYPRFQGENLEKNKVLYERVAALASKYECTPGQLALAWVMHQGNDVVPIPGTSKIPNLDENIGAAFVKLTPEEVREIAAAVPEHDVAGLRYNEHNMSSSYTRVATPPLHSYIPEE